MLFNSTQFIFFFILLCLLYQVVPGRLRKGFLLAVSLLFYAFWDPRFLILLGAVILVTWFGGQMIEKDRKKGSFFFLLVLVFAPLFFFKYFTFFVMQIEALFRVAGISAALPKPGLILPVGISFFTFQAVGYLVDVWRKKIPAEKNLVSYALFLSFFPQQASGPIGRAGQLLPQFERLERPKYEQVLTGMTYMLYGYFQKVLVADGLGAVVDSVYGSFQEHNSMTLLLATFLYSAEIYCDFAGYSNIALGAGKVLGVDLIQNFQAPYLASSVAEFWRRWHISLTTWFRDYLYIPLGGNRKGRGRQYLNILIVFLVSGLWHGASIHYMVWGALNGIYQIIGRTLLPLRDRICRWLEIDRETFSHQIYKRVTTFLLVNFSWVFFRMDSTGESLLFFKTILVNVKLNVFELKSWFMPEVPTRVRAVLLIGILVVFLVDLAIYHGKKLAEGLVKQSGWMKIAVFLTMIFGILICGHYGGEFDASKFIYLQY